MAHSSKLNKLLHHVIFMINYKNVYDNTLNNKIKFIVL